MSVPLAIVCATRGEPLIEPFLLDFQRLAARLGGSLTLVADGPDARDRLADLPVVTDRPLSIYLATHGVHLTVGELVEHSTAEYLLFLDDDERVTPAFERWILAREHHHAATWLLARAWLWPNASTHISSQPHWPDYQHRLGRPSAITVPTRIHGGWIARGNKPSIAPIEVAIEHYKLLLRSQESREATVRAYEAVAHGAGMPKLYLPDATVVLTHAWQAA